MTIEEVQFLKESNAIEGYEGLYFIFRDGRIWSSISQIFLKPVIVSNGYAHITLCKENTKKQYTIHSLVLKSFLSQKNKGLVANHKNGIKSDNRLKNLEWVTSKENSIHSWKTGLSKTSIKHKKSAINAGESRRKLKTQEVLMIRESSLSTYVLAKMYNLHQSCIWRIKKKITYANIH